MRFSFSLCFILALHFSFAQLAHITFANEQKYEVNVKRGIAVVTPFSKNFHSTFINDFIEDGENGYVKFFILKGNTGSTKAGPYIHFLKLDQKLNIRSEYDTQLLSDESSSLEPVATFRTGNVLNLITATADAGLNHLNYACWQFKLSDFSILKKNVGLVSLPFDQNKMYDFRLAESSEGKNFGLFIFEEGRKKENLNLYCVSFDDAFQTHFKKNTTLPFPADKGRILNTEINPDGTIYALLNYEEKGNNFGSNSLLIVSKEKQQLLPLVNNTEPLINCAFTTSKSGDVTFAGLTTPSKKGYCKSLVIGHILNNEKLQVGKEEIFDEALLDALNNTDKNGIKQYYFIRSVNMRDNATIDVVLSYCKQEGNMGYNAFEHTSTAYQTTDVSDILVLSFTGNKLTTTNIFQRNLEEEEKNLFHIVQPERFSVPEVFTTGNDLYLMYLDNPSNLAGSNNKHKIKQTGFSDCSFTLAKIDNNNKVTQQQLITFERKSDFSSYFGFMVDKISEKKYILSLDKYHVFSRAVNTMSALLQIN